MGKVTTADPSKRPENKKSKKEITFMDNYNDMEEYRQELNQAVENETDYKELYIQAVLDYEKLTQDCAELNEAYELLQKKFLFSERRYNQLEEQQNILFKVIDELLKKGNIEF